MAGVSRNGIVVMTTLVFLLSAANYPVLQSFYQSVEGLSIPEIELMMPAPTKAGTIPFSANSLSLRIPPSFNSSIIDLNHSAEVLVAGTLNLISMLLAIKANSLHLSLFCRRILFLKKFNGRCF